MADVGHESLFRDGRGEGITRRLGPQLLATFISGEVGMPFVHWYFREFHAFVDSSTYKVDIFHDWGKITGIEPEARQQFTRWAEERRELNRRACRGIHTLVESTLMYLVLEASGAFSRANYRHAYRDRSAFERERDRMLVAPSTELMERGEKLPRL
jgi:hypothetical protein